MTLLIDAGNTRLKWGRLTQQGIESRGQAAHKDVPNGFEELTALDSVPERVLVANVAGAGFARSLLNFLQERFGIAPEFVSVTARAHGVHNSYADPRHMGVDRWVAMIGAYNQFGGPVCVVDAGTAVTIDAVDAAGHHLGGCIAPGVNLMRNSLLRDTSDIASAAVQRDRAVTDMFATDTATAVEAGVVYSLAALIDRAADQMETGSDVAPRIVLTGGDAELLLEPLQHSAEIVPDLVLRGLAVFAGREA